MPNPVILIRNSMVNKAVNTMLQMSSACAYAALVWFRRQSC